VRYRTDARLTDAIRLLPASKVRERALRMDWFRFTLGAIATWRITHLFIVEDGPWEVFARIRKFAATGFLRGLLDCFYCLSLWVAIPFSILLGHSTSDRFLLWLALSGAAILLENLSTRLGGPAPPTYFEEGENNDELLRQEQHDGNPRS